MGKESKMWDFFRKCDSDDGIKRAQCKFCSNILNYNSTTYNLKSHLMRIHQDKVQMLYSPQRRFTSFIRIKNYPLWSFFTKSSSDATVAICNKCEKTFSIKSTITNLKTHLKSCHPEGYDKLLSVTEDNDNDKNDKENESEEEEGAEEEQEVAQFGCNNTDEESDHSTTNPDLWSFFEKETGGRARCVVCRASLPHRFDDLKKHLKDNHPKLALLLFKDRGEASENEEDRTQTFTEVVYLEDEVRKPIKRDPPPRRQSVKTIPAVKKCKRKLSSSPEHRERHDDEYEDQINKFSNYVACLLKQVPKETCMRLQMEIINLIMATKLKLTSEPTESKMLIDGVPVSIQTVSAVPGAGYVLTVPTTVPTTQYKTTITAEEVRVDPLTSECRDLPKL